MNEFKDINQDDNIISVTKETAELFEYCKTFTDVFVPIKFDTEIFVELFNIIYLKDVYDLYSENLIKRSNWTHLTANTFFRTCQILGFKCEFESINRHDGVMRNENGEVFLVSEWEIDEQSIFLENGELNKLLKSCKTLKTTDAFLFTYNTKMDLKLYINKIHEHWNIGLEDINYRLMLVTAIFDDGESSRVKLLKGLRTFVIGKGTIDIWETLI